MWSDEALAHDPRWEGLREAARAILVQLGEHYHDPTFDEAEQDSYRSVLVF